MPMMAASLGDHRRYSLSFFESGVYMANKDDSL